MGDGHIFVGVDAGVGGQQPRAPQSSRQSVKERLKRPVMPYARLQLLKVALVGGTVQEAVCLGLPWFSISGTSTCDIKVYILAAMSEVPAARWGNAYMAARVGRSTERPQLESPKPRGRSAAVDFEFGVL